VANFLGHPANETLPYRKLGYTRTSNYVYRVAQKSKPLPNNKKIVLNRIKACQ